MEDGVVLSGVVTPIITSSDDVQLMRDASIKFTATTTCVDVTGGLNTTDFDVIPTSSANYYPQIGGGVDGSADAYLALSGGTSGNGNLAIQARGTYGEIKFYTGGSSGSASTTERLRITSSGNVGIGTASPANPLHVTASLSGNDLVYLNNINPTASDVLRLNTAGNGSGTNILDVQSAGTSHFLVRGDGRVRVGGTAPTSDTTNFTIYGNSANSGRVADFYRQTSTSSNHIQNWYSNVGGTATIQQVHEASGDIESRTNSFGGTSDRTLKENITDATNQWDDIKALQFKNYNFIGDPDKPQLGVIAQDVEAAGMTGLVKTSEETGKMSVKYSMVYMKAVIALQEAMARIEALEARIVALEAE